MSNLLEQVPQPDINLFPAETLLAEYQTIRTYDEATNWDRRAGEELKRLAGLPAKVNAQLVQIKRLIANEEADYKALPFFIRWFASRRERDALRVELHMRNGIFETIASLSDQLDATIAATPNSKEERTELLKELRLRRKELVAEKREASAAMREIRSQARQAGAQIGPGRTYRRMELRLAKEAALRPHETERDAIERQIISVDKMIVWLQRFEN